eukprot:COSAG02_NODE_13818_length_1343_cov_2.037781_2_plen_48_part_00
MGTRLLEFGSAHGADALCVDSSASTRARRRVGFELLASIFGGQVLCI